MAGSDPRRIVGATGGWASASLTSSAIPATEPARPDASSGIMTSLVLGAEPILASASVYFCATK